VVKISIRGIVFEWGAGAAKTEREAHISHVHRATAYSGRSALIFFCESSCQRSNSLPTSMLRTSGRASSHAMIFVSLASGSSERRPSSTTTSSLSPLSTASTITSVCFYGFPNEGVKELIKAILCVSQNGEFSSPLSEFAIMLLFPESLLHLLTFPGGNRLAPPFELHCSLQRREGKQGRESPPPHYSLGQRGVPSARRPGSSKSITIPIVA